MLRHSCQITLASVGLAALGIAGQTTTAAYAHAGTPRPRVTAPAAPLGTGAIVESGEPAGDDEDATISVREADGTLHALTYGHDPELSSDGQTLVFKRGTSSDRFAAQVYRATLGEGTDGPEVSDITEVEGDAGPTIGTAMAVAPNGDTYIVYDDDANLYEQDLTSGAARQPLLTNAGDIDSHSDDPQISPDGTTVVFHNTTLKGLYTAPLTGSSRPRSQVPGTAGHIDVDASYSPDGCYLAYLQSTDDDTQPAGAGPENIYVLPTGKSGCTATETTAFPVTPSPIGYGGLSSVRWSPDSSAVYDDAVIAGPGGLGGRLGIYRFEVTSPATAPELVSTKLVPSGQAPTGTDTAFDLGDGPGVSTTLPLTLEPGATASAFDVVVDSSDSGGSDVFQSEEGDRLSFTLSGITGLTASDVTLTDTETGAVVPLTDVDGAVYGSEDDAIGNHPGRASRLTFSLALAPQTPAGTLQTSVAIGVPELKASSDSPVIVGAPLPPVTGVTATAGDGTATVSFDAAAGLPTGDAVDHYTVQLTPTGSGVATPAPASVPAAGPFTAAFSGLTDGQTYDATVSYVNATGRQAPASTPPVAVTPVGPPVTPPPGAVGNVAATPGDRQATVSFSPAATGTPASAYLVTLTPPTGAPVSATTPGSPVIVPGLTNGVTYAVTVVAESSAGNSPVSSQAVSVTPHGRPAAPHLTGIEPSPQALLIGFTPADGDGLRVTGNTVRCIAKKYATGTAHTLKSPVKITHLHNGVNYTCAVTATFSDGETLTSNKVVAHPGKLPNVALTLVKTAKKGTRITIVATLTSAGDLVKHRLATLMVQYKNFGTFTAVATGYTNNKGQVTYHFTLRRTTVFRVSALFGPAIAFNHGDRVTAV